MTMKGPRIWDLVKESTTMALIQRTVSLVVMIITAIMIITVTLTTGRTAGAESDVLSTIDEDQTRIFMITTPASANVYPDVIDRIDQLTGIEWAAAFGPVVDVQPFDGGPPYGLRPAWGDIMTGFNFQRTRLRFQSHVDMDICQSHRGPAIGWAGRWANSRGVADYAIIGTLAVPAAVSSYEP